MSETKTDLDLEKEKEINSAIDTELTEILEQIQQPPTTQQVEIREHKLPMPEKKDVIKQDALLKGILNDDGVFDLLDVVLAEMAEESASLKFERIKKEFNEESTDRISLRRANILKMISDSLIQKRNLALNDFVNLRSPQWQVVFSHLMTKVKQTFNDLNYSSEQVELFFQHLQVNLEGFEDDTEQKLKESMSQSG